MTRFAIFLLMPAFSYATPQRFDVVVYGATSGGTIAALAAQQGRSVALLEPGRHIGGMLSGGLGRTDMDRQQNVIGGMAREFFERAGRAYGEPIAWFFESHVAEQVFASWVRDSGVRTFLGRRLAGVNKHASRIIALHTSNGEDFAGSVFIDGSYEGDLLKAAGVSYSVGREPISKYNETLAGRQDILPGPHQFRVPISPHAQNGSLLPYIVRQSDVSATGQGDGHVQTYCFRICLTDDPANRIPIEAPSGYDPEHFGLARSYAEALADSAKISDFLGISRLPNHKTDINSTGAVSTDVPSLSWRYVEGSFEERQRIRKEYLDWAHGLLYFLAHDSRVPKRLQREVSQWGLPKDEFADTGHWPHQLYVRDARRMTGEYVLTQHDLQENRSKPDSIGMGGYNIDIREVQWIAHRVYRFPKAEDEVLMEGYLSFPVEPYEIPYRALLPRERECSNLIVPVCISTSDVAYGSFRMEPQYMIAGQAAGIAASIACSRRVDVQHVDITQLQNLLAAGKQILHLR